MNPKSIAFTAVFSFLLLQVGVAETPKTAGASFASTVENIVATLESTEYQHKTEIDLENRDLKCDCSGFLGFLLKKHFPDSYQSLDGKESPWRSRPLAVTFYETFLRAGEEEIAGWSRISSLGEAKPGDLLAWRKGEIVRGESTGHVLMIAGVPEREADGRYRVRVIDSTRSIHAEDTRPDGTNGVGAGIMWFDVDESGKPVRYFVDDRRKPGKSTLIAMGRLEREN